MTRVSNIHGKISISMRVHLTSIEAPVQTPTSNKHENAESVTDCSLLRDLDPDRVFDASYILQVSSFELSRAFTNPEHMSRAVVELSCKQPTQRTVAVAII